MKTILFLLIFSATTVFGQSLTVGSEADFEIIKNLNLEHAKAFATANSEVLDKHILADDFILIGTDGQLYNKTQVVSDVVKSKSSVKNIASHQVENVIIRFVTDDVAMVHARVRFNKADGSIIDQVQYNDIYAKKRGKWTCVSGNNSLVN